MNIYTLKYNHQGSHCVITFIIIPSIFCSVISNISSSLRYSDIFYIFNKYFLDYCESSRRGSLQSTLP